MANRLKWGTLESEEAITNEIDAAYKVISKRTGKMVNGTFVKDEK